MNKTGTDIQINVRIVQIILETVRNLTDKNQTATI